MIVRRGGIYSATAAGEAWLEEQKAKRAARDAAADAIREQEGQAEAATADQKNGIEPTN